MKNKLGKTEILKEYHKNGKLSYVFKIFPNGKFCKKTYDNRGNQTSFKDSSGFSCDSTYDNRGNETSYEDSDNFSWEKTFDSQDRMTSYKNSSGYSWKRIYKEDGTYEQTNL